MLHFHWLKHSWRRANIFRYRKVYSGIFPFVKKYGSFLCKDEQTGEVKTIATNPLQWRHKNKAIATKLLQSDVVVFLSATLPYSYLVRIQTVSFSLVRFQHIQAINTIITVLSICTGNITLGHHMELASTDLRLLRPRVIFPGTDWKYSCYCISATFFIFYFRGLQESQTIQLPHILWSGHVQHRYHFTSSFPVSTLCE